LRKRNRTLSLTGKIVYVLNPILSSNENCFSFHFFTSFSSWISLVDFFMMDYFLRGLFSGMDSNPMDRYDPIILSSLLANLKVS